MSVNRIAKSGNYRMGKLFQARSIERSLRKNRPHLGRATQTMGIQASQQKVKNMGTVQILQIGKQPKMGIQRYF